MRRHNDSAGVHTPLTRQSFKAQGILDDLVNVRVLFVILSELRGLGVALVILVEDTRNRNVLTHDRWRQGLRQLLPHFEVAPQNTRGVLQSLLRLDSTVGNDLRNTVFAVLLLDVLDDFIATTFVKVNVEVGHRNTFGVQEAFEDEPVVEGVELRDLHRVGDHGSCTGTTAGPHADSLALRPVDVVRNRQEVTGEPHLDDDVFLVFSLLTHSIRNSLRESLLKSLFNFLDEPRGLVFPFGHREVRHIRGAFRGGTEVNLASFGNLKRRITGLGQLFPDRAHFFGGTDVVAIAVKFEAIRVRDSRPRVNTQERILDPAVFFLHIVRIVGRYQRSIHELG